MKRLLYTLVIMLTTLSPICAKDGGGHRLTSLWNDYDKAVKADRPKKQAAILADIKKQAETGHLPWDYYDASHRYVQVLSAGNWKLREGLERQMSEDLDRFGEPVAIIYDRRDGTESLLAYIRANEDKLKSSSNPEFWSRDYRISSFYGTELPARLFRSDYDYALWCLFSENRDNSVIASLMHAVYDGTYPLGALLRYSELTAAGDEEMMAVFAEEHAGDAVGIFAESWLLDKRFSRMQDGRTSRPEDYLKLKEDCLELNRKASELKGVEKTLASEGSIRTKILIERLTSSELSPEVNDGILRLALKNLGTATIEVKSGKKTVFRTAVENTARSFFVPDTLAVTLPELDDGEYDLICTSGNHKIDSQFSKFSLSMTSRSNASGLGVYVADYISGRPAEKYTLTLFYQDKAIAAYEGFVQDGFTTIPTELSGKMEPDRWGYYLQASLKDADGKLHKSRQHRISPYRPDRSRDLYTEESIHGIIFTDRSAFRPDETVRFKTIIYNGAYEYQTIPEGVGLTAVLNDAEGKEIGRQALVTGEFGSAAGEFLLKKRQRGGLYSITIERDGHQLCGTSVLVDEFVMPSFSISWTDDGRLYLPGDGVCAKGNVKSYSGHALGAAEAIYSISRYGQTLESGPLPLSGNGDFEIRFRTGTEDYSSYLITVSVTDATGETLEFRKDITTSRNLYATVRIDNPAKGSFSLKDGHSGGSIISGDELLFSISQDGKKVHPSFRCDYTLTRNGRTVSSGQAAAGEQISLPLKDKEPGLYILNTLCSAKSDSGNEYSETKKTSILYSPDGATAIYDELSSFFKEPDTEDLALEVGSGCGPVWAVAELYGNGNELLDRQSVRLEGFKDKPGSLKTIHFSRKDGYPSEMRIKVLWFKDKESHSYSRDLILPDAGHKLPLGFTRFLDTTEPERGYSFSITTLPGIECAATIFDAATESLQSNRWHEVRPFARPTPDIDYQTSTGRYASYLVPVTGYGVRGRMYKSTAADMMGPSYDVALEESAATNSTGSDEGPTVREDFAGTVAWEPFLRSDKDGRISLSFNNADKLSTYYVQLFAHDKAMHNAVLRREMLVTLPVKVAMIEPMFLYDGDRYTARLTVSNSSENDIHGKIALKFIDGDDYTSGKVIDSGETQTEVPAGGSAVFSCGFRAPATGCIGLLASFTPDSDGAGSDAVFVRIPVYPALQTITETHSALLKAGMDRDSLIRTLRGEFRNGDASAASVREISIMQMLKEAIPAKISPKGEDALSISEALYADWLLGKIPETDSLRLTETAREELIGKLVAARNQDGGFGWFRGMTSSPIVSAVILERAAKMGADCPENLSRLVPDAVRYIDRTFLGNSARPLWYGGLSLEQYLSLRILYPEVRPDTDGARNLKEFRKAAKEYLVPSKERGLNGLVFAKARRIMTLKALTEKEGGTSLASFFGIRAFRTAKMRKSLEKDILSIIEYAEPHKSGGMYFPNAVMPWRGLLESELYAHTVLCNLLSECGQNEIAEGIRLWMMIQKETQQWGTDPACIEALAAVLEGNGQTLRTNVTVLSLTLSKPFTEVKAAGNGFSVSREYYRDGRQLNDGDTLRLGDKVTAKYNIWSEENRSFVKLTAPRCAAFRPVEQRSGQYGWAARPLAAGWTGIVPQGYRSVLSDRTEYWFDSYPEEKTCITEEFFVTQEGTFQTPAVEIESLYAPHYRANDDGSRPVQIISRSEAAAQP